MPVIKFLFTFLILNIFYFAFGDRTCHYEKVCSLETAETLSSNIETPKRGKSGPKGSKGDRGFAGDKGEKGSGCEDVIANEMSRRNKLYVERIVNLENKVEYLSQKIVDIFSKYFVNQY